MSEVIQSSFEEEEQLYHYVPQDLLAEKKK